MSHVVLTCACPAGCPVPGHGTVPPDPVDPQDLADAPAEYIAVYDTCFHLHEHPERQAHNGLADQATAGTHNDSQAPQ